MTAGPQKTLTRALAYAKHGWPVFPCKPGSKEPATRHGFRDATTDPNQIRQWWQTLPRANLAIATGSPGPDVLDVDRHGTAGNGFAAYNRLKKEGLLDGAAAIIATPSGGLHVYFAGSDQPCGRLPGQHLDFKARGGYVLAPPSQVRGRGYRLVACPAGSGRLDWTAATRLLEPQRQQVASSSGVAAEPGRLAAWVEGLPEGNRNAGLFWAACRAAESGRADLLDDLATAAAKTGLTPREINRTIASAKRAIRRTAALSLEREAAR